MPRLNPDNLYIEILTIHQEEKFESLDKYTRLRRILERICDDQTEEVPIEFRGLYERLKYVCDNNKLNKSLAFGLHSLRVSANKIIHEGLIPKEIHYLSQVKMLALSISNIYKRPIPNELNSIFPDKESLPSKKRSDLIKTENILVEIVEVHDTVLTCSPINESSENIKVKINETKINDAFSSTYVFKKGRILNLLKNSIDKDGEQLI